MTFRHGRKDLERPIGRWVQPAFGALLLLSTFLTLWYAVSMLWGEGRTTESTFLLWAAMLILCVSPIMLVLSWRLLVGKADLGLFPPLASVILGVVILAGGVWLGLHLEESNAGPRGLLGLFLAGGWSLRIGLAGLSKKRRHGDDA
ncbi:MAG: hypothetical protein ACXU9O_11500 [Gemmatimonadaceae bacterium]